MHNPQIKEVYLGHDLEQVARRAAVINGVTRSGTTILGKILSTLENVEYEFEPWSLISIPVAAEAGLIEKSFAQKLFLKNANEIIITRLMGRSVNLRKTDDSHFLNLFSQEELDYRWHKIKDRKEAIQYAKKRGVLFLTKVTNLHEHYPFLLKSFKRVKIIHIVRNGLDVALSISKKQWYGSDRLKSPEYFNLSKLVSKGDCLEGEVMPFHIPAEETDSFLKEADFGKALMVWCILMEKNALRIKEGLLTPENYLEIRYESLLEDPERVVDGMARFIGANVTRLTGDVLKTLQKEKLKVVQNYPLDKISPMLRARAGKILSDYGYLTQPISPISA